MKKKLSPNASHIQEKLPYEIFAEIYDPVMNHVKYEDWAKKILSDYKKHRGSTPRNILDQACGTGRLLAKMKRKLPKAKYYGLDISESMINIAKLHCKSVLFTVAAMNKRIYSESKFDLITSTHDSINYITNEKDLQDYFNETYRILQSGGLFFVDFTTEENIIKNFHGNIIKLNKRNYLLKWSNHYQKRTRLLSSYLEFTNLQTGVETTEVHLQRFYHISKIEKIAKKSGFSIIDRLSNYEEIYQSKNCDLICLVLKAVK